MSGCEIRSNSAGLYARTERTDCRNDRSRRSSYCDNTRSCCIGRRHVSGRNEVVHKVQNGSTSRGHPPRSLSPRARNIIKAHCIETSNAFVDSQYMQFVAWITTRLHILIIMLHVYDVDRETRREWFWSVVNSRWTLSEFLSAILLNFDTVLY